MASEGVTVDFEPRQEVIEGIRASGHWARDGAWLEIEELRMPFVFRVHGVDLIPRERHALAPLFFVARIVPWFVRNLRDGDGDDLWIPAGGAVWARRSADRVLLRRLRPPGPAETVETEYSMLLSAVEGCSSRIRDYLAKELPEIVGNPDLAPWFRGEEG